MTKFEEALLQDVMNRLARLGREKHLFLQHAAQAAYAGSEHAAQCMRRHVGDLVNEIHDEILPIVKESLAPHYAVWGSILCLISYKFDEVSVREITDTVVKKLAT